MTLKLHKTAFPAIENLHEAYRMSPDQGATRTYQNLFYSVNTVYRIEIGLVEKKISITDWTEGLFCIFGFPQNVKKHVFRKKNSRFFDKLIIKNVQ